MIPTPNAEQNAAIAQEPILQFFTYGHLSTTYLQLVSRSFHELAHELVKTLPRNPERTVALRKLLESKDSAVRAALYRDPSKPAPKPGA